MALDGVKDVGVSAEFSTIMIYYSPDIEHGMLFSLKSEAKKILDGMPVAFAQISR